MILFTQRKELENKYREWIKRYDLKDSAFNVITFLSGSGLLVETMDAAVFVQEKERMCDYYQQSCTGCPLYEEFGDISDEEMLIRNPYKAVILVKQWSEEHKEE